MKRTNLKPYCLLALTVIGLALFVLYFDTVCLGAARLVRILFPFFLGAAIAFVLNRPFEFFRSLFGRRNLSPKAARLLSVCTVYILALGAAALLACLAVPQLLENLALFSENVGQYLAQAEDFLQRAAARFGIEGLSFSRAASFLQESAGPLAASAQPVLPRIADATAGLFTGAANLFIGIVLSVYLLNGKDMLLAQVRRLCRAYLPPRAQRISRRLARTVIQVFDDYVAGQCKEAVILGAYISGAVGVLLLLFVSPSKALLFLVFFIILQQMEGNIIYPKVVGHKIGLPGMWVLLAISVGGGLWGIWGMLISVPVITILYRLLRQDVRRRGRVLRGQREAF